MVWEIGNYDLKPRIMNSDVGNYDFGGQKYDFEGLKL